MYTDRLPGDPHTGQFIRVAFLSWLTAAVYARGLSAQKSSRVKASKLLRGPMDRVPSDAETLSWDGGLSEAIKLATDPRMKAEFVEAVRLALFASKICSYAQGFVQLQAAATEHNWELDYGQCALLWRGGCIIRAQFLDRITEAFKVDGDLENLLLAPYFMEAVHRAQFSWRRVVTLATQMGLPVPAFSTALGYFDSFRRATLPANLLQAQRDYFGAHTYQRTDREGTFHTDWLSLRKTPKS